MNIAKLIGDMTTYYDYSNNAYTNTSMSDTAAAGVMIYVFLFALVLIVISYVVSAYLLGRIFKKAGIKSWKAWVPVYNNWIMLEMGDQKGFWAVLAFVPFVNIVSMVFMYIAMYHIGLKLHKEGAFVLLAIFLPIVWFIWLAVDSSTWEGKKTAPQPQPTTPVQS